MLRSEGLHVLVRLIEDDDGVSYSLKRRFWCVTLCLCLAWGIFVYSFIHMLAAAHTLCLVFLGLDF